MEYKINKDECLRRDELPRLMQHAVNSYSNGGLNWILVGDSLRKPAPKFPEKHKKTLRDIRKMEEFLNIKKNITNKTKEELIKLYNEDSDIHSLVSLVICWQCNQNPQCPNYQNYLISKSIN